MKIALVSIWPLSNDSIGGTEKFIRELATGLKLIGHEVHCVSPSAVKKYFEIPHRKISIGLSVVNEFTLRSYLDKCGFNFFLERVKKELERLCDDEKYEGIIFNSPLLACDLGIRSTLVIHDDPKAIRNYFGISIARKIMQSIREIRSIKIVVPSHYCRSLFKKIAQVRILVIPHALPRRVQPLVHSLAARVPESIIIPSRLEPKQKGQDIAISAIALVRDAKYKIKLIIAGDVSYYSIQKKELSFQAKESGVPVRFCRTYNIKSLLSRADIALVPSRYESFGYAAQEAICFAPSVILSDIPSFKEIGRGLRSIIYFKSGSAKSLSLALIKSMKRRNVRCVVPQKWLKRYDYDTWIRKYGKLFI